MTFLLYEQDLAGALSQIVPVARISENSEEKFTIR